MTMKDLVAALNRPAWEYEVQPPSETMGDLWQQQFEWAQEAFGPGRRDKGIIAHLRSEIDELEANPDDIFEAIDLIFLAADHALRVLAADGDLQPGRTLEQFWLAKFDKNRRRSWPKVGPDEPSFHVKGVED